MSDLTCACVPAAVSMPATVSLSGNTVTGVFSKDTTIAVQTGLSFANAQLNLVGLCDGTPVAVNLSVTPTIALTFTGQGSATVLTNIDLPSCTAPPPLPPVTVDDLTFVQRRSEDYVRRRPNWSETLPRPAIARFRASRRTFDSTSTRSGQRDIRRKTQQGQ